MPHAKHLLLLALSTLLPACTTHSPPSPPPFPSLEHAILSPTDLYGDLARSQPTGPTYSFFQSLLPPLRYVNSSFAYCPISLSAPASPVKVRLLSNGSSINPLGRNLNWVNETGIPATIHVGANMELFGSDLSRLDGPRYSNGYLPIVQTAYHQGPTTYAEECFAPVDPSLASHGAAYLRLGVKTAPYHVKQKIEVWFDANLTSDIKTDDVKPWTHDGHLFNSDGKIVAAFDNHWSYTRGRSVLTAFLPPGENAYLAIYTLPLDPPPPTSNPTPPTAPRDSTERAEVRSAAAGSDHHHHANFTAAFGPRDYALAHNACAKTWNLLLSTGTQIHVPEDLVNNAWRATLIANYEILHDDRMQYSVGNQYAGLYIGEGGDTTRAFALYGHPDTCRQIIPVFMNYTRAGLEYHQAGFKLQMLAHYYFLTRDTVYLRQTRPLWEREINVILKGRDPSTGMFPPEKYAGDLAQRVPSLNSNANCWRALSDFSFVLADLAEHPATTAATTLPATTLTNPKYSDAPNESASRLRTYPTDYSNTSEQDLSTLCSTTAAEYRKIILAALAKSLDHSTSPPFMPIDLSGHEKPHTQITADAPGSYWNIMIQYVLGSNLFPPDSKYATDLLTYLRTHGGVFMGLSRCNLRGTQWIQNGPTGINDLYGLRTAIAQLQRDETDRALVTFYGTLAQGLTQNTFIGCEGSSIVPLDQFGRQMFLPPNSAANAYFLFQLRYLLIQDFDLHNTGHPDTLRLCYATPPAWLADGKSIQVQNAPTTFGPVSFTLHSHLSSHTITADLDLPPAPHTYLRLRLPSGHHLTSATIHNQTLTPDPTGSLDLTGLRGELTLHATIR